MSVNAVHALEPGVWGRLGHQPRTPGQNLRHVEKHLVSACPLTMPCVYVQQSYTLHWVQDLVRAEFRKRLRGALPRDGGSGGVDHAERAGSSG